MIRRQYDKLADWREEDGEPGNDDSTTCTLSPCRKPPRNLSQRSRSVRNNADGGFGQMSKTDASSGRKVRMDALTNYVKLRNTPSPKVVARKQFSLTTKRGR